MENLAHKLHPFEYVGAQRLYEEERFLLADDMGMFKTAQAIFANSKFREKKKGKLRTLIVTPTSVREHWARELEKWAHPKGDINIAYAGNLPKAVSSIKNSDWTVISYPLVARLDEFTLKKFQNIGFHQVIIDEAHNAKNPNALRTKAIKKLADQADYVSLLSGTPIPNTMSDLYVLMSLLDPVQYPFNPDSKDAENLRAARQSFIHLYLQRPQAVKELLHRKMLRREANDYLGEHIPKLHQHRVEISLSGRHLDTYLETLDKEMDVGKKIMELAKVSLDPMLVDNSLPREIRGKNVSLKYRFLEDIIEKETQKKRGKVLVFTNLKRGIIDPLVEKYERFGAIKITGDISTEDGTREKLRKKFQQDPDTQILFATTTMNEGVDLTAATAVVNLTIPWTPAEFYQRFKRSQRPGEIKKNRVDVYTPFTTLPGKRSSFEQASLEMLDTKKKIVSYLVKGMQVSLEELKTFDETKRVPKIVHAITSPNKAVLQYYIKWRGVGSDSASKRMKKNPEVSKYMAELYPQFSMAKNAANIYIPIIKKIEKRKILETKVDVACGPGMLGYFLDEPTIGIDINQDMLNVGKELCGKNKLIRGTMDQLPLKKGSSDLAVCSLAYQMTSPKEERARSLQEMSRVLEHRGYAILTVPGGYMNSQNRTRFEEVISEYGFDVKNSKRKVGPSKIDFYVLQKIRKPSDKVYGLRWDGDPGRKKK